MISLGSVLFSHRGEDQIDWIDRHQWQPIGQSLRYGLAGNPVIMENPRSGRPIVLSAELPWCWLESTTVEATTVRFNRSQGPLNLTPIDPRRQYYTGTIALIEVI